MVAVEGLVSSAKRDGIGVVSMIRRGVQCKVAWGGRMVYAKMPSGGVVEVRCGVPPALVV